jgi:hypothetical protein
MRFPREDQMPTTISMSSGLSVWHGLYRTALFESDSEKVSGRIAEAEKALVIRARELFGADGDNVEEEEALDDAMYALHALRNAWQHRNAWQQRPKAASVSDDYFVARRA